MKKVAIIMGSDSDLPIVRKAIDTLAAFEIPYEVHVYSAHRTPAEAGEFAANARKNGTDATRWVEAHWENGGTGKSSDEYEAMLQVNAFDRIGMLADISVALADMRVSILQVNTVKRPDDQTVINLKISCKNIEHFSSIMSRIGSLKDVISVTRGYM